MHNSFSMAVQVFSLNTKLLMYFYSLWVFLTAAWCTNKEFYTTPPIPPENGNKLLYCMRYILQTSRVFKSFGFAKLVQATLGHLLKVN